MLKELHVAAQLPRLYGKCRPHFFFHLNVICWYVPSHNMYVWRGWALDMTFLFPFSNKALTVYNGK